MRNYEAIKSFEENENDEDLEIGNQEQEHEHEQEQISDSTTTTTKLKNKIVVDEQQPKSHCLLSLDVFRGLTVALMILVDDAGGLIPALNHSPWNGLTIADFVMPFFLFIVGVSLAFTYKKPSCKVDATRKSILRALKLLALGIFLQGGYVHRVNDLSFGVDLKQIRWMGILQIIALAYLITTLCEIWLKREDIVNCGSTLLRKYRYQWALALFLSVIYLCLLYGMYVPDWEYEVPTEPSKAPMIFSVKCGVRGDTGPACNVVGIIDRSLLGIQHLYRRPIYARIPECSINFPDYGPLPPDAPSWCQAPFDPEGLLSSVMAIVTCLVGLHYGESLPVTRHPGQEVFSGSTCKQGEIEAVVIATGVHTFFGKAAHLVDNTNNVGHFQMVLKSIGNFCICSIAVGMLAEIIVMYPIQHRKYRDGIDNLLVLLIGGIPIAMPTVLSVTMASGSHKISQQGAITKRMTAIEEMAGMDVLCSDYTGTLTLNKLSVDRNLILLAARAARTENQDAIDAAIVGMLADPKEARAGIAEVHFLPFNPNDKRTALTYIDNKDGTWHRASKGALEQIIELCNMREDAQKKIHSMIEKFAERGLRSLGVARQEVPEKTKESAGAPWQFVGLLSVFDPPRHDSAETIRQALNLGVNVKMITGDQLAIVKETGRRLGMGTNMYPSATLLGLDKDSSVASMPVEELIEKADGFAGVFPEHKYEIVKKLQERKHIC
ncbi:hypothetical protein RYX36_026685 [Vicia faba]